MAHTATDAQITKVLEITGENDYVFVAALVVKLTDGQWARAKQLLDAWDEEYAPGSSGISLRGGSDGVYYLPTEAGNDIRSRMRLLLGLPEFRDSDLTGTPTTTAIPVIPVF